MDFSWTAEQSALRDEVAGFGCDRLGRDLIRRDQVQEFDVDGWRQAAALRLTGLVMPERFGGRGLDPLTAAFVLEGLGYGCRDNGILLALGAHLWGCVHPIASVGTEAQKQTYLPRLCGGDMGALAITEPSAGSDLAQIETTARREGNGYILNGRKILVTNAPLADVLLVVASLDRARGGLGLACFLVERGNPGLTLTSNTSKMGLRTATLGDVVLRDCVVPVDNLLGVEGAGFAIFQSAMDWERGFILAPAVGTMQRIFEQCCRRAANRQQFGRRIAEFQHISGKLVRMHSALESSRALLYKAAWLKSLGRPSSRDSALAKLFVSESWVSCCQDALQIHGGEGYLVNDEVERELRDALGSTIYSGTSELLRVFIARNLVLQ
jgi:alkylation response protein AidB-like acyl-CoA dehydrogenase